MIIDSHVHLSDPPYSHDILSFEIADGSVIDTSMERADFTVERLLSDMDDYNIEKALVMAMPGMLSNDTLSEIIKVHSNRLYGFARVSDPYDIGRSREEMEKGVKEQGLIGLKLHPGAQNFVPSDPEILPLFRKAVELDIPVLIHSFPWPPGYIYNNSPEHIDRVKKNVPESTIIVAHMGGQRFLDLLTIATQPGIYVETSHTLPLIADLYGVDFTVRFLRKIGIGNVLYGSDWFGLKSMISVQLDLIDKLDLAREEKDRILGENIRGIMSL